MCAKINFVTRSCFVQCLQKAIIVKAVFINLFDILPKIIVCQAKYPAGYPVSGLHRISGIRPSPDIRQKQYPVHP
jgi:hypothetical protein